MTGKKVKLLPQVTNGFYSPIEKKLLGYFYAVDFKVKDYEIYYIKNYSTTGVSKFVAILLRSGNSQ